MATPGRATQPFRTEIFKLSLEEPDEIRVLVLQPGQGAEDVYCKLMRTTLNDSDWPLETANEAVLAPQPYEALSWCWGNEEKQDDIRVCPPNETDYLQFKVSKHLNAALHALRYQNKPRTLWVDAICMDQESTEERNSQVPKMDRIYGQAENVCIWIGASNDDSKRALPFIKEHILKKIWYFDDICSNKAYTESWTALMRVMSRPWFSRVSTLQRSSSLRVQE